MKTSLRRSVTRASLAVASAVALAFGFAAPAAASDAVDQQQMLTISYQRQIPMLAQTFTAGVSGGVDRVSLASDTTTGFANVRVSIETVSGAGAPSGTVLGSTSWSGAVQCCRAFHDFGFSPAVSVTSGSKYAIVVQTVAGVFTWWNSSTVDNYAGGQLYVAGCSGCAWSTGGSFGEDFAFQTWATTATNQPPAVGSDSSAVTAAEGASPANSGTFSDPDGDTVALSASSGTVTRTGLSKGTWAWNGSAADEGAAGTVTITASDGHGGTATTSFTVTVTGIAPAVHVTSGPASSPEGSSVTVGGSASSPDADDNKAGFSYSWQVTKNGASYASGNGATFTFTPDDNGTYVATLQATDDGGMKGTDSMTVAGTNVAPTAHIAGVTASAPPALLPWETLTFAGSFTDPGVLDTHTVTWDFGDGTSSSANFAPGGSANFTTTHAYAAPGYYNLTLTVTDKDGGVGTASSGVDVQTVSEALDALTTYVNGLPGLNAGQKQSLLAHLSAAAGASSRGNNNAAGNELNAFLNELQADVNSGKVSTENAATLRLAIHAVQSALGTFNRFLGWWPLEA
jgi:PKD domain/K319L-like, PKD domain/Bacterial Ig domain